MKTINARNHFDASMSINKHHATEFGQPLLTDTENVDHWWNERHDSAIATDEFASDDRLKHDLGMILGVSVARMAPEQPAKPVRHTEPEASESKKSGYQEPDFFEDERAFWVLGDGVVSMPVNYLDQMEVIETLPRMKWTPDGLGWQRIQTSHYGIDAVDFEGRPLSAHQGWIALASIKEA